MMTKEHDDQRTWWPSNQAKISKNPVLDTYLCYIPCY
jgi:hypothetical protein